MGKSTPDHQGKRALVTGASSGIGLELARLCAAEGMHVVVVANEPEIHDAAEQLSASGASVHAIEADLSDGPQIDRVIAETVSTGPLDFVFANVGHGLGKAFLDESFADITHVINTNITGNVYLLHRLLPAMVNRGEGRVLLTGSIAGILPGSFSAVYNGTKAFIDNFAYGLRDELRDTGVSVTCLMPGPTDTRFFERADMLDTKVGQPETRKDDPADVARTGFDAMMKGEASVVHGMQNKMQAAMANVLPKTASAEQHRKMAEPGTAKEH
jgi:uncharacterized protein